ncbi:uroporphyrinogen-III C-methyltransferase [Hominifimenecus sp. rT4P-3]|uniref:uroporphyrinogen-III C-methyltransferase n=1 Tax=Hominifimenecus sp. rT4P-3 TaxID=3242979 RepID=UPI003DA40C36
MQGKVWLVGAGPSDLGLLTLKGKEVLERAEVLVYDALVGAEILALAPPAAERINVGKRASHHIRSQEEINQILLEKAKEGKRVVRLKGGDPFLFGRGGEELELLAENQIPFEVVPGVTSAIAVPAYNGIPVTHRDACSSVHIITGHKKKDQPLSMDFEALVRLKGTLVFLMGVSALKEICEGLLAAGMPEDTPAAILEKGTTAGQRRVVADVASLPGRAEQEQIGTPAIIVVGEVCRYSKAFSWAEKRPLFGCRVIVTRPRESASKLSGKLREKGAEVLEIPAIATEPIAENPEFEKVLLEWEQYSWLAFTSPAGVRIFFDEWKRRERDLRALAGKKLAAIGSGTARELKERGIFPDLVPEVYDGAELGRLLAERCEENAAILIPRAFVGSPEILEKLAARPDLTVKDLPIYETRYEKPVILKIKEELEKYPDTMVIFTSASTVHGFAAVAENVDFSTVQALCIGEKTAAAAAELGMRTKVSSKASIASLVELAEEVCREKR